MILPALLLAVAPALAGQSLLERSPNMHGTWTLDPGSAAFVFAHRFEFIRGGDEISNVPTLTLALGLPLGVTAGLDYSSFSEIVRSNRAGNETQYWLKRGVGLGSATRVAGMVAYNTAAESVDGAASLRRELGPVSIFGELRGYSDLFGAGEAGSAGAVGAGIRLTPYLGVTGDVGRVLSEDSFPAVWSAALAIAIPGTPHTFSLQATNGGAITLQGAARSKELGEKPTRYGFVFTVPLGNGSQWSRIFRSSEPTLPATAGLPQPPAAGDSVAARVEIRMVAYAPKEIRIRAGQSVEWINRDPVVHTVTAEDGSWSSEMMAEGARYVRRFDRPGRYPYKCLPHPMMSGVVIVE